MEEVSEAAVCGDAAAAELATGVVLWFTNSCPLRPATFVCTDGAGDSRVFGAGSSISGDAPSVEA